MLKSALFAGNRLLQDIADDVGHARISQLENANDPAVLKVQQALLVWDPNSLPVAGADGIFGAESAAAVHRFKLNELGTPEEAVIDDVGPATVQRLDEIALAAEVASITLYNQYGDVLSDVAFTLEEGGAMTDGVTDSLGRATVAVTARSTLTLDAPTLASALGNLLDRPVQAPDPTDPGDAQVITPQTKGAMEIRHGEHLNVVVVARVDLFVEPITTLEGTVRVMGEGVKVFQEGARVRVALQVNGGSAVSVFLDPPPQAGSITPLPIFTGWELPNGYVVQPADTEESLSQRFLGAPDRFAELSDHPPVAGETLTLPDSSIPGWIKVAADPLPPPAQPKIWFTATPNETITSVYVDLGAPAFHDLLDAIARPPPRDPDPSVVSALRADLINAFAAMPGELIEAEFVSDETGDYWSSDE